MKLSCPREGLHFRQKAYVKTWALIVGMHAYVSRRHMVVFSFHFTTTHTAISKANSTAVACDTSQNVGKQRWWSSIDNFWLNSLALILIRSGCVDTISPRWPISSNSSASCLLIWQLGWNAFVWLLMSIKSKYTEETLTPLWPEGNNKRSAAACWSTEVK